VYFFCSGALRLLAQEFDLYFFSRSQRTDWATEQLRALASGWFDVASLSAEPLDAFLRQHALDVLIDLGGWMDPIGLRAISTKPAARMYKWVGGQSVTTGLRAFDGWLSDAGQTPAGFETWFTEPLVRLPHGYVTYTPPPYMPAPVPRSAHEHVLGVIANPVKVSKAFLVALSTSLQTRKASALPLQLRFIDKRYLHSALQERILSALDGAQKKLGTQLSVQFIAPPDHQSYLSAVGQLSEMLDTFPYTGGLTTMEALTLGVACSGRAGQLYCERHTHAHLYYAQLPGQARSDHTALARSLSQLFTHGSVEEAQP
jgi:predicted O-linked N-acetylglucosamine transferase (SPINDLY family)